MGKLVSNLHCFFSGGVWKSDWCTRWYPIIFCLQLRATWGNTIKSVQGWEPERKIGVPQIRWGGGKKFRITFFIFPEICPNARFETNYFFFGLIILLGKFPCEVDRDAVIICTVGICSCICTSCLNWWSLKAFLWVHMQVHNTVLCK